MPPGTPYESFILPYDIRVDAFSSVVSSTRVPALHLLTHTHSDHIVGLSSKSFASVIVCSHDAKEMLLRHEVYKEREFFETDVRAEKVKTFSHLKIDPIANGDWKSSPAMGRDLLVNLPHLSLVHSSLVQKPIPLNCPTTFELRGNETVTITLIDANHCPGAVMFVFSTLASWHFLTRIDSIIHQVPHRGPSREYFAHWRFPSRTLFLARYNMQSIPETVSILSPPPSQRQRTRIEKSFRLLVLGHCKYHVALGYTAQSRSPCKGSPM